jgi:hypothetical protein
MVLRLQGSLRALRSTAAAASSAHTMFCAPFAHAGGAPPSPAGAYGRSM